MKPTSDRHRSLRLALLCLTFLVGGPVTILAIETRSIKELLEMPSSFHLRLLRLQGLVREVSPPVQIHARLGVSHTYRFTLDDGTASIPVLVTCTRCVTPDSLDRVAPGDKVLVSGQFSYAGDTGRLPKAEIVASMTHIRRLGSQL